MPKPRETAAAVLGVLLGGALSTFLTGRVAFAAPPSASLRISFPSLLATQGRAPRLAATSAADKEKVAKPPPSKTKPDHSKSDQPKEEEESGNGFFHFIGAILSSPSPPPAPTPATAFASEASRWSVGSEAWIVAPAAMDSVALWEAPVDPAHPDTLEVGALPHGLHVVVVETHAMASGFWTRVQPFEGAEPSGWVPSWILANGPAPKPGAPRPPKPDPRWRMRGLLAYGGLGPADLDVEYRGGGVHIDAQYMRLMNYQWISGFGFGYREIHGSPKQAYLSGTTLEDPHDSRLQTYEIGARAGQRYGDRTGFRFDWMLGPTLAYVHENTNLLVYEVIPPDTFVPVGPAGDHLGRWAGGGELRTNFAWPLPGGAGAPEVGLHLGAFMFAWEGHEQHSLATDFVHGNIHGWDIGLSITIGPGFF
jgi:hypothetical protein